jgi:hypothetical protein
MGKYFNDVFVVRASGAGGSVTRTISTVPQDGVVAKNSVYMERSYPVTSGMAQIFAAIRGEALDANVINDMNARQQAAAPTSIPRVEPRPPASAVA